MKKLFLLAATALVVPAYSQDYSSPSFSLIADNAALNTATGSTVFSDADSEDFAQIAVDSANDTAYAILATSGFNEVLVSIDLTSNNLTLVGANDFEDSNVDGDTDIAFQQGVYFDSFNGVIYFGDDRDSGSFSDNEMHSVNVTTGVTDEIISADANLTQWRGIVQLNTTTYAVATDDDFGSVEQVTLVDMTGPSTSAAVTAADMPGTEANVEIEAIAVNAAFEPHVLDTGNGQIVRIENITSTPIVTDVTPAPWTSLDLNTDWYNLVFTPGDDIIATDSNGLVIWDGSTSYSVTFADIEAALGVTAVEFNAGSGVVVYDENNLDPAISLIVADANNAGIYRIDFPSTTDVSDWNMFD